MWYTGAKEFATAPRQRQQHAPALPARSQSQTSLRPRQCGEALPPVTAQRPRADAAGGAAWQRSANGRGALQGAGRAGRVIGKSPPATAAAVLSLSASTDLLGHEAADVAQAKELVRLGPWSVRRAPGGPDAGLLFVNVETGRAQREPPREVLEELGMGEEEEEGEGGDAGAEESDAPTTERGARSGGSSSRPATGSSGTRPASAPCAAKFQRILLGNGRDLPLAMARDILAALREDATLFDEVRRRFSDTPRDETPVELDGLPEELEGVAAALAPGEISGVIGTEAGMQILLRVC